MVQDTSENNMQNQIEEINKDIERNEKFIKLAEHLKALEKNEDFKALIEEHFFKEHAQNQVKLMGDSNMSKEKKEDVQQEILVIGGFHAHLRDIKLLGLYAKNTLKELEETKLALEMEDGEE